MNELLNYFGKSMKYVILTVILSFNSLIVFAQMDIKSLPIFEYPAVHGKNMQIIYLSGDGGMNDFSKSLCKSFQEQGYSVVALDSKKYFWKAKSPDVFATDMAGIINHYEALWGCDSFTLLGYSFGADVGSFLPQRLPLKLKNNMRLAVMLDPSISTDFEIKLSDMLGGNSENRKFSIINELNSLDDQRIVCFFSEDESNSIIDRIKNNKIKIKMLPGDHRFNNDYLLIIQYIVQLI
jgi:type IV secretory pathway VirJ component